MSRIGGSYDRRESLKRGVYLLPIFPALSLICVLVGNRPDVLGELCRSTIRRYAAVLLAVASIELALFTVALPRLDEEKSPRPIAEAATSHSQIGEEIGVFGMSPLEGGIGYYGERHVVSLRDETRLRDFLDRGGRFVILRDRELDALGSRLGLRAIERFRSGKRRLALAQRVNSLPQRAAQ